MKTWADKTICKICGKEVSKCSLSGHLKWSHNKMTYKEYFDTYEEPYEHNCPYCGKECKWIGKGGRHYAQTCGSKECLSKIHSDNNGGGTPEALRKIKQTKLERYGNENYQNTEKIRQTCLERYGVDNPAKLDSIKSKIQDTIIKNNIHRNTGNYGVYYNGEKFDSKSELLYYYWCKENGFDIIKNPTPIEYYIEGVRHLYYPDFIVNGQYVEIKGEHLIDNDGYLLNFTDGVRLVEKTKCLLEHNVKIILHSDVEKLYIPSNYEDILKKCISFKHIRDNIVFPKCPYCGDYVKISKNNPLTFTHTCCKKECVKKEHSKNKDKITGKFKKRIKL